MTKNPDGTYTLTKDEYDGMVDNENLLYALEAAGVDNWEGYDEARKIYNEQND